MGSRFITLFARLILIVLILAASAAGGAWLFYRAQKSEYQAFLEAENARLLERSKMLEGMISRLSRTHRLAQIVVTDQRYVRNAEDRPEAGATSGYRLPQHTGVNWNAPDRPGIETTLLIVELDEHENPLRRWEVTIPGQVAFFDGLVVKFGFDTVAEGHPLRGKSIALLRRVYSESLPPERGIALDESDEIPAGYRVLGEDANAEVSEHAERAAFERKIWQQFWDIANDPVLASEFGVRVAQGEAVYKPMVPGVLYELTIDAVGGLNLETRPLPEAVSEVLASIPSVDETR